MIFGFSIMNIYNSCSEKLTKTERMIKMQKKRPKENCKQNLLDAQNILE